MGFVSLSVRLARTLHSRWLRLGPADRERLAPLARDARDRALDLRGASDRDQAERELKAANESLAAAIVASAEADPEVDEAEVQGLRADLRRELDRLARADVKASRTTSSQPAQ
ncbi:MAG: hypothetical protein M3350_02030 [Actinomycetota bacterium]|nr:hypothetical protein [Actinomycetota bacterium]MDQ3719552.1 hypothetical protein [Actinomycetota bacterium]